MATLLDFASHVATQASAILRKKCFLEPFYKPRCSVLRRNWPLCFCSAFHSTFLCSGFHSHLLTAHLAPPILHVCHWTEETQWYKLILAVYRSV